MPMTAIERFIAAVNASDKLRKECEEALDNSEDPGRFVELAAKNGYNFTEKEVLSYFENILHAPSSEAVSAQKLNYVVGAKDEPSGDLRPNSERLKQAVIMFRTMTFKKTPRWTDFGF